MLAPAFRHHLLRGLLIAGFLWLVGRHWHPYFGFTRFLQLDAWSAGVTVPELRDAPIFTYKDGYDGHYYAQLAARPAVDDPVLKVSIDDVAYRARRILLSWIAWVVGGGDPVAAVRTYAWLNLVVWGGLAALLWRVFPATGWRETLAWAGILFSAGVLHGVRLALTDPLALLLVAGATVLAVRGRLGPAAGWLAIGGLARETVLLGGVTLLPEKPTRMADFRRVALWGLLVVLPLVAWLLYLRVVLGTSKAGVANFYLPFAGWVAKWSECLGWLRSEPDHFLAITTLLGHVALTAQFLYLAWRREIQNPWWRLGAVYGGLMIFLGTAVWQGHPGAAARVLLPLTLAFNVLAVSHRAGPAWLLLGNLSVLSGVLTFWNVPVLTHEVAAGRVAGSAYVVRGDDRWYPSEGTPTRLWAWNPGDGRLQLDLHPRADGAHRVKIALRSVNSRTVEIKTAGRLLWRGEIGVKTQWIELPEIAFVRGRVFLDLHSDAPPVRENADAGGRALGFAVYGVKLD